MSTACAVWRGGDILSQSRVWEDVCGVRVREGEGRHLRRGGDVLGEVERRRERRACDIGHTHVHLPRGTHGVRWGAIGGVP